MFPILSHIDWERLGEQSDAVCECLVYVRVSFFFFLKTIYFWKTVVVVPFWAPRMYTFAVKKKKVPPNMLNALQRLLMGVSFFSFFFFFFHCGLSRCFHLPFGWASLLWCTSRRFSGLLHKAFRMFFFFFFSFNSFETVATNRAFYTVHIFLSSVQSPPFFKITADVLHLLRQP